MLQRSPILRFALEVFEHAVERAVSDRPRDRKLAVMNLAQCVELAVKAALVERNETIYRKDSKTIDPHEALRQLAAVWDVARVPMHSRLEVLIDERNAIQHRYGDVDEVTLDYHLETAFKTLEEILQREFDVELSDWVRDSVPEDVWRRVRFVELPEAAPAPPSQASIPNRSPALALVDGFSRYETAIRGIVRDRTGEKLGAGSTLDLAIKTLASIDPPLSALIRELPTVYRLRNRVIHGERAATDEEVKVGLGNLDAALNALRTADADLLKRALATVRLGTRGALVLSWEEIRSVEDYLGQKGAKSTQEHPAPSGDDDSA